MVIPLIAGAAPTVRRGREAEPKALTLPVLTQAFGNGVHKRRKRAVSEIARPSPLPCPSEGELVLRSGDPHVEETAFLLQRVRLVIRSAQGEEAILHTGDVYHRKL